MNFSRFISLWTVATVPVLAMFCVCVFGGQVSPMRGLMALTLGLGLAALFAWNTYRTRDDWGKLLAAALAALERRATVNEVALGDEPVFLDSPEEAEFQPSAEAFRSMSQTVHAHLRELSLKHGEFERDVSLLKTVLETMVEGVLVVDDQHRLLYVNPAARQLLEVSARDVVGRHAWGVVRSLDLREAAAAVLATGNPQQMEIELVRQKAVVAVWGTRLPLKPSPGVVLVLQNVTELRRLERLRREFVSNVSHELKTPLTSIKAFADTLLDGAIDDPDCNRLFLQRIIEQGNRLENLILDLLRLAKIESQAEAFQIEPISIQSALADCFEYQQPLALSKPVELVTVPAPDDLKILADAEGFRTILNNLVGNAVNYTPSGGRVQIRWSRAGDQVQIEVEDSGIGIPAEHLDRIFERFYRVDKARSREIGGTGLGLAIVKHLVQEFHGRIEVTSQLNKGSCFRLWFPEAK